MKDRRPIDDLSIEEIERVLADKKRAAREARSLAARVLFNAEARSTAEKHGLC